MTVETSIFGALRALASDRVYRDIAPQTVTDLPCITFQQVGGQAVNFLDSAVPSKKNARFQVNCWAISRDAAAVLSRQVEGAMRTLNATVLSAPVAVYEPDPPLYGTRQDFSLWHTD